MAKKTLISPQVYTFETDKSDYISNKQGAKALPVTSTSTGGGTKLPNNNNNNTNFILLEDSNYLLQEDGSKLILY